MNPKVTIDFGKYHTHDEMTAGLRALAEAYPELARLSSIGHSHQGRDIWAMEITNRATGRRRTSRPSMSTATATGKR